MAVASTVLAEELAPCSVEALDLSVRAHNILRNLGIETIGDLARADATSLLAAQNCGRKTIAEIMACLKMMGLKMANSDAIFADDVIAGYAASLRTGSVITRG